jgi:serine/threonine-protein kinase SRPK1
LFQELLGKIPKKVALSGKYSKEFFDGKGRMKSVPEIERWTLQDVLVDKYQWDRNVAQEFANFLLPMLRYDPKKRATAAQCLRHPWLNSHNPDLPSSESEEENENDDPEE